MGYNKLSDSGMTDDERRNEATRITKIIRNSGETARMTDKEAGFVTEMLDENRAVSTAQLFWLRDIKAKYVD